MRKVFFISFFTILLASGQNQSKQEMPTVTTTSNMVTLQLGKQIIHKEISFEEFSEGGDTIYLDANANNYTFGIYTDIDTLKQIVPINTSFIFRLVKDNNPPLVIVVKNELDITFLEFGNTINDQLSFIYEDDINSPYLQQLRNEYPIDSLAALGNTDLEKVRHITSWVHGLWKHDGMNEPEKRDALYILEEVKKGRRFRCVEYGIVASACLNAIGLKSRTLALKTKDVETTPSGAGHVLMEVFLNDQKKWIMIDSQFDMIAHINNVPLNAVELQQAISENKSIDFWTTEEDDKSMYIPWIYPYLYYFSFSFDNRENIPPGQRFLINDKSDIMLVPIGAKEPTVFQQKYPINYCIYTNSLGDFYREP